MLLLFGFALTLFFGYLIVLSISDRLSGEEKIALSFGFGLGFLTLLMFYLSRLEVILTPLNIILSIVFISALLKIFFLRRKKIFPKIKISLRDFRWLLISLPALLFVLFIFNKIKILFLPQAFLILAALGGLLTLGSILFKKTKLSTLLMATIIFFCFLTVLVMGIYWPIHEWDSLALYDFRGKLFFWQQSVSFPQDLPNFNYYVVYPYLTSIVHAFTYLLNGQNPKFIYSLFYGALLLIFFSFLRKETNLRISLFFTLLLGSTSFLLEQAASSYTNLPFAFYQITGALFLYRFLKSKKMENITLSGISLGLSAWTRPAAEPFFLACLLVLLVANFSWRKVLSPLIFLAIYLLVGYPWQIYVKYGLKEIIFDAGWFIKGSSYSLSHYPQNLLNFPALGEVFQRFTSILTDFRFYGAGGILFLLFIFFNPGGLKKEKSLLFLIFLNFLFWIASIFALGVMGSFKPAWKIILNDSMVRVFLGIYPLLLFYVAKTDLVWEIFEKRKKDASNDATFAKAK